MEERSSSFFKDIVKFAIIATVIVVPFRLYIAQPFIVSGASMDPTFVDGQYLIVDQLTYELSSPERGDVIIFKYPNDTTKFFIKRVIGLPNETVRINGKKVSIINTEHPEGIVLNEQYISPQNEKLDDYSITLGTGEYFVMGDNRLGSLDSRAWGPVPEKLITGRPVLRLLPFNTSGILPGKVHFSE